MRYLIIGYGIQGKKRHKILKKKCVGILDPYKNSANFKSLKTVDPKIFDNAVVSVPYNHQEKILKMLIKMKKNILIDKPIILKNKKSFTSLQKEIKKNKIIIKTSYNHQYEKSIEKCIKLLKKKSIGDIYNLNMFYGNGTAKNIKSSNWKDTRNGVRNDLMPHLLMILISILKKKKLKLVYKLDKKYENNSPDYSLLNLTCNNIVISLRASYLSWKNSFKLEIYGSNGAVLIDGLCKWGSSKLTHLVRKFPSGKPYEKSYLFKDKDKSFLKEIEIFEKEIKKNKTSSISTDSWIFSLIN